MSDRIGIVGQGFVGSAVYAGLVPHFKDLVTYDKYKGSHCGTLEQLVDQSDVIFVCLPTPMRRDGSCDTRIVDGALADIRDLCREKGYNNRVAVVKSTVEPGSTVAWNRKFNPHLTVVFNPEFLTEANHIEDFKNQNRIVLGGPRPETGRVKTLFRKAFPTATIVKTGSTEAETVKYFTNCFLATKVAFANEMYQLCNSLDIDYDKVVEYALYDQRIGNSHLSVPGPDGSLGYGGHCLPKDLNAMINLAKRNGIDPKVMQATWDKNNEVRPEAERDWEKMVGRAISD